MGSIHRFLKLESAGGILLVVAAILAIVAVNSPLAGFYDAFVGMPFEIRVGSLELAKPLILWINDGLMAVFFLLVGLEVKREVLAGELSRKEQVLSPLFAAIGGILVPAGVFLALTTEDPSAQRGWAIPAATDIAFSLGILSLLGSRVPLAVKVFLTAVAIIDDIAAIVIIALFYTSEVQWPALAGAAACTSILFIVNRARIGSIVPYMLLGVGLWVCLLKSGVHATLAGVVLALTIPMRVGESSPLKQLEHGLHPWVAFFVMPVFAFANAGVSLSGMSFGDLLQPLPLAIALGLFLGKQFGVFLFTYIPTYIGLTQRPKGVSWPQLYGAALLSGIGFTMSLFVGGLAFDDPQRTTAVRLGVLAGSLLSGVAGYLVMRMASPVNTPPVRGRSRGLDAATSDRLAGSYDPSPRESISVRSSRTTRAGA